MRGAAARVMHHGGWAGLGAMSLFVFGDSARLELVSLCLLMTLVHAPESSSLVCAAPATGFCTTCDACCADLSEAGCNACIKSECDAQRRCTRTSSAEGGEACNVCPGCCDKLWLRTQHDCDACVSATCAGGTEQPPSCASYGSVTHPAVCSAICWNSCWTSPFSSPCIRDCATNPIVLLVLVILSFAGRLSDFVVGLGLWVCTCCQAAHGPEYMTCLDRPFVQLETKAAREHKKNVITVHEEDQRRQGYFDYALASAKYGQTEWKFLLDIDSVTYRRDTEEAQAMLRRILKKARTGGGAPPHNPLNEPGHWDFFLSHG